MEWMAIIGDSVQYIEDHITEDVTTDEVAKAVGVSTFYFQKGFSMLCGFSPAEYIRNRRLALAGNDLLITNEKIISFGEICRMRNLTKAVPVSGSLGRGL